MTADPMTITQAPEDRALDILLNFDGSPEDACFPAETMPLILVSSLIQRISDLEALSLPVNGQGSGWIVGNGDDTRWRAWDQGCPVWVDDRAKATRYSRREDAEAVHAEDEDAWTVKPFAAQQAPISDDTKAGDGKP